MAETISGVPPSEAVPPATSTIPATSADELVTDALNGWATFRQAVNRTLPDQLDQAASVGATTDRLLASLGR